MFSWEYTESVDTTATAKQVWSIWERAQDWPTWDSELEWVKMDGPFAQGTKGTMKPRSGPIVLFELIIVEENSQFIDCARLPLTTINFIHRYENMPDGSAQIVHAVKMQGFLAPLFGLLIGTKIRKHLRSAMLKLSDFAVAPRDGAGQ